MSGAPASPDAASSCDELDAELNRLLLEDDDPERGEVAALRPSPPSPQSRAVVALDARLTALETLLDERLEQLQSLAEARIYAAAVDAAHSVRRTLAASNNATAGTSE